MVDGVKVDGVESVAVVGGGTMGAGIAQLAASCGCTVTLIEVDEGTLQRAVSGIAARLDRKVEKGSIDQTERDAVLARVQITNTISDAGRIDFAVEAVTENLDLKQKIFRSLEAAATEDAVLATNTSSLSVTTIAENATHPERIVGMHFFNPAPVMPLVEIISGGKSNKSSVNRAFDVAKSWGKTPVIAKDTPGFIVNRVARGYYLEALRLHSEGVAGVDEIDQTMKTHAGFKMGPFELMDLVGLDVNLAVSTSVWEQMNKAARFLPHPTQQALVKDGKLGRKTKRGFYVYDETAPIPAVPVERSSFELSPLLSDAMRAFAERSGATNAGTTEQYILCRILGAIFNEAGMALCENVATRGDIDIAMIKGTNYPKGPLDWSDEVGPNTVRGVLNALNATVTDGRYQPAPFFCV
jgi:3-hydroxybutyryl-CoA dehydrogenase